MSTSPNPIPSHRTESLHTDERGVSVTVNYVLALAITTVLVSGLVVSTSGLVEDRREQALETQLRAIGNQLAADLTRAEALSRRGGTVALRAPRPGLAGGESYQVELAPCPGGGGSCLNLTAAGSGVSVAVPVHNETPVSFDVVGDEWLVETTATGSSVEPPRSDVAAPNVGVGQGISARPSQRDVVDPRNREPIPGFVFEPSYPFPNQSVIFVNDTTDLDGNIAGFEWDFGDGSANVTGSVTSHSYATPGRYDVTLLVTDDEMAEASVSKQILVTGLVYNNDARSRDPDNDGYHGGVRFSVTNEFDSTAEISDVYVDPVDPPGTVSALSDRDDDTGDEGPKAVEIYVDADQDAWYDYGQNESGDPVPDDDEDSVEGEPLTANGTIADLDLELGDDFTGVATSEQNAEVAPGSTATISLTEFRDDVTMAGRNVTVGLRYQVDGEQYTSRFVIEPIGGPDAAFTVSDDEPDEGESVSFDAAPSSDPEGNIVDYSWDFGDGATATGPTATHSYGSHGKYVVTLTVIDDDGYTDSTSRIVFVQDDDVVWAVNTGGSAYTSDNGVVYEADENYSGGNTFSTAGAIDGTTDDFVYQSERYGDFTYETPLPDGEYEVTLKFAEVYWSDTGERQFDVRIEGTEYVTDLDIYAEAGKNTAYDETYTVNVSDGKITLEFDTDTDNAKIAAIVVSDSDGGGSPKLDPPPLDRQRLHARAFSGGVK
jgi:PKD repeat protein